MNPLNYLWWAIIVLVAVLLGLLWITPTYAQEEMKHPETGEVGVWVPTEVQRGHLLTEAELNTCNVVSTRLKTALEKKHQETTNLRVALDASDNAQDKLKDVITATSLELENEKDHGQVLMNWLYGTSGVAVVAVALVVVLAL